jgi:hypothetical protein
LPATFASDLSVRPTLQQPNRVAHGPKACAECDAPPRITRRAASCAPSLSEGVGDVAIAATIKALMRVGEGNLEVSESLECKRSSAERRYPHRGVAWPVLGG